MTARFPNISILFFGTPQFAVNSLQALHASGVSIIAVVTQPDKPAGRGKKLTPPPVKEWAQLHDLPIFQPSSIRNFRFGPDGTVDGLLDPEGARLCAFLSTLQRPDLAVVVAYGKIIPTQLLSYPHLAAVNVHASLLPRWRGAAPIQRALLAGDQKTGVCIMKMEEGLDTGPVYATQEIIIDSADDFGSLHDKLAKQGAELLVKTLKTIVDGGQAHTQSSTGITYAEKWTAEDSVINWNKSAPAIVNQVRACSPTPGARTKFQGEVIKVFSPRIFRDTLSGNWENGTIIMVSAAELIVAAGENTFLTIGELQFPGKRRLPISEITKGRNIAPGMRFNTE